MINVLILAAGLGSRLRPLTTDLPKPLVPIVDQSILAHQLRLAKSLESISLHINAFYLAEKLKKEANALGIEHVWVESPEILGTGGPLRRLYQEGVRGDLLVLNGDCYTEVHLAQFLSNSEASGAFISLLGIDEPKVNTLNIDSNSFLSGVANSFGDDSVEKATFSGISWYKEDALKEILDSERNVVHFWKRMNQLKNKIYVDLSQKKALWIDMGTPEGLMKANMARLNELGIDSWVDPLHPLAKQKNNFHQSVVHKHAKVALGAVLNRVILFDGAEVLENEVVSNQIRGDGFRWNL